VVAYDDLSLPVEFCRAAFFAKVLRALRHQFNVAKLCELRPVLSQATVAYDDVSWPVKFRGAVVVG
jgi:hypothetical protein